MEILGDVFPTNMKWPRWNSNPSVFDSKIHILNVYWFPAWFLTHCFFWIFWDMSTVWLQTSCQPRAYGPWLVHFFTAFLQNHPHPCSDTGLQWGHCAWPWNSILPSDLRLLSVDLYMNTSEQRTEPQHEGLTLPQFSVTSVPPTESAFVSFMLSTLPLPPCPGPVAVMQLLSDLIYFFFMLNAIIHSHNGMSSALIVIIRLFYTLTALDMKRNCWIPGYVFHYLTPFSFPTCPCGIWHILSS